MADGSLIFDTKIDESGFSKGLSSLSSKMGKVGAGLAKGIGLASTAVAGFGAYSLKAGMDFQAGMSEVQAISGATGDDLNRLTDKAKEMGSKTKFSATESAEALKYMAMAGWKTEEMLGGLDGVMNLAAASGESLATVSDIVTDAMTAFGMKANEAGRFADVLAAASSNSNTNVSMLGESFKYVAPIAGTLGYSVEDTALALGVMANAGIKASQAGTTLRSALTRMADPTGKVQEAMADLGIQMFTVDGTAKPLGQVLNELRESFDGLTDSEKASYAQTIFGKQAMSGMLAIIDSSDKDFNKLAKAIDNSAGSAENMANIMNDNLKGDLVIMMSALEGVGISLYENIDTPMRTVVQNVTGYLSKLNVALNKDLASVPKLIGEMMADAVTNLASQLPKFIDIGVQIISSLIDGIMQSSDQIASSAVNIISTLSIGILNAGVKLVDAGAKLILKIGEGLIQAAPSLIPRVIEIIGNLAKSFNENASQLLDVGVRLIKAIAEGLWNSRGELAKAVPEILSVFTKLWLAWKGATVGKSLINNISTSLLSNSGFLSNAGNKLISNFGKSLISNGKILSGVGGKLLNPMISAIKGTGGKLLGTSGGMLIAEFGGKLLAGGGKLVAVGTKLIGILAGVLSNPIGIAAAGIVIVATLVKALNVDVGGLFQAGGRLIGMVAKGITNGIKLIPKVAGQIIKALVTGIWSFPGKLLEAGKGLVKGIAEGIKGEKPSFKDDTKETISSGIDEAVSETETTQYGSDLVDGIVDGLQSGTTDLVDAYRQLIEAGFSDSEARTIINEAGQADTDAYIQAIMQSADGVGQAFLELKMRGLDELEAVEQLIELGGLNIEGYKNGVNENGETLIDLYQSLKEQGLTSLEAVEELFSLGTSNASAYGQGVDAGTPEIIGKFQMLRDAGATELQALDLFNEKGMLNVEAFGQGSQIGLEKVKEIYSNLREAGLSEVEAMQKLYDIGLVNVDGHASGITAESGTIEEAYQQMADAGLEASDMADLLREKGFTNVEAFLMGQQEASGGLQGMLEQSIHAPTTEFLSQQKDEMMQSGRDNIEGYSQGITEGGANVANAVNEVADSGKTALDTKTSEFNSQGKKIPEEISSGINSGSGQVTSSINKLGSGIETSVTNTSNKVKSSANSMMNGFNNSVSSGANKVNSTVSQMSSNVGNQITQMGNKVSQASSQMMNNFGREINRGITEANRNFTNLANDVNKNITNMSNTMTRTTTQMMNSFVTAVTSGANKAKTAISNMCRSSVSTVNSFRGQFISAGRNLSYGLASGISSGRSAVISSAVRIMRNAVSAAKRAAAIHSPSKIWEKEIGYQLPAGTSVGIDKGSKLVEKSSKNLMENLVDQAKGEVDLETNLIGNVLGFNYTGSAKLNADGSMNVTIGNGEIRTVVELDGRAVGESVSPFVSKEISRDKRR